MIIYSDSNFLSSSLSEWWPEHFHNTEDFPFRCSNSGFTYLGIKISPNLSELWKLNISPTLRTVKRDLQRWWNLPLSFMGRISLIKMNVLPRILYPLQMLPLWMPRKVASSIEKLFSEFVWHGKKPREKIKIVQMPTRAGGLGLPNILFYNWACHARIGVGFAHILTQPSVLTLGLAHLYLCGA